MVQPWLAALVLWQNSSQSRVGRKQGLWTCVWSLVWIRASRADLFVILGFSTKTSTYIQNLMSYRAEPKLIWVIKVPRAKKAAAAEAQAKNVKLLTSPVVRNNFGCIRWGLFCVQTCWEAKGVKLQIGKIHVFSARCIRGNDQSMPSLLVKAWLTGRTTVVRPAAPIQSQLIPGRISRRKSFTGTTTVVSASDWRCLWESFYPREWQSTCPVSSQWLSSQSA